MDNGNSILKTDKATIRFGGLVAVNELDLNVGRGEIFGLIGPNGAGKTTIFNLLTGVYEPTSGDIRINGTRVNGLRPFQISRLGVSRTNFLWVGFFAVITVVVVHNIVKSDTGRALVSIREDELAAEAMGVNTTRYKVTSFVISSAFAGIAGVLFAHYNKFLSTNDFQFIKSFEVIIMIVLGGMGSMTGAIVGAIVVTLLPELLRNLPDIQLGATVFKFADLRLVIFALILILTMILRPQGIFGTNEFGLSWLKRPRKKDEGTSAVGADAGAPIAEQKEAKRMQSEDED